MADGRNSLHALDGDSVTLRSVKYWVESCILTSRRQAQLPSDAMERKFRDMPFKCSCENPIALPEFTIYRPT
jgi:hypothetical protein